MITTVLITEKRLKIKRQSNNRVQKADVNGQKIKKINNISWLKGAKINKENLQVWPKNCMLCQCNKFIESGLKLTRNIKDNCNRLLTFQTIRKRDQLRFIRSKNKNFENKSRICK